MPYRPERMDWCKVLIRIAMMMLVVVGVILFINLLRRGGAGVVMAATAPAAAATLMRRSAKRRRDTRPEINQEFLKFNLKRIGETEPVLTPVELCHVVNSLFEKEGREHPFDSPQHMARELKKLGLKSSVRSVAGRSDRRWYDLAGYGTHGHVA